MTRFRTDDLGHTIVNQQPLRESPVFDRRTEQRLFVLGFAARIVVITLLMVLAASVNELSRDSGQYHERGIRKAAEYAEGINNWALWIDHGWYEVIGILYYFFRATILWVLLLNAVLAAAGGILVYRISRVAFQSEAIAYGAALIHTLFPSTVYYTSLPLKEAASILGLLCIVWGIVSLIGRCSKVPWLWMAVGFAVIACLRVYLVPVLIGCTLISIMFGISSGTARALPKVFLSTAMLAAASLLVFKAFDVKPTDSTALEYYDIDKVNEVRQKMTRGNARIFSSRKEAAFGDDILDNLAKAGRGLLVFFFTINPANVTRVRQLAAVPELLFFLYCLPCLFRGIVAGWKKRARYVAPIIIFAFVLILVYSTATTNAGAMYRWRLQALPFLIMLIVYGAAERRRGVIYKLVGRLERPHSAWGPPS